MKFHLLPVIVRLALAGSIVLAGLVSFYAYQVTDETIPHGYPHALTITKVDGPLSDRDAIRLIEAAAQSERLNLLKDVRDTGTRRKGRTLFAFVGDPARFAGEFPGGRYPTFGASMETTLKPSVAVLHHDLRGLYFSDSDQGAVERLLEGFGRVGIEASSDPVDFAFVWQRVLDDLGLVPVGTAIAIFVILAFASAGVRVQKSRALASLHGASEWRSLVCELGQLSRLAAVMSVGAVTLVALGLLLVNGLAQAAEFAVWLAAALCAATCICLAAHLLTFLLMPAPPPFATIRGKRPLLFVAAVASVCQVLAVTLVLSTVSACAISSEASQASSKGVDRWTLSTDLVGTRVSMDLATDPQNELTARFGQLYDDVRARRGSVLAYGAPGATAADGYEPYTGNAILANPEFLDREVVRREDGRRIRANDVKPGVVTLLVPADLSSKAREIQGTYREFATFQRSLEGGTSSHAAVRLSTISTRPRQEIFNFSDGSSGSTTQVDPVIAIFPYAGHYLSMNFYLASASTQNLLFWDAATMRQLISEYSLDDLVVGLSRPAEMAMRVKADAERKLFTLAVASVAAGLCLLLSSFFLASAYIGARRRVIFVRNVHGSGFVRSHTSFLVVAVCTTFLILFMLERSGHVDPSALPYTVVLCLSSLAVLFVTLLHSQRRSISLLQE